MNLCGVVQYIDTAAPELQLIDVRSTLFLQKQIVKTFLSSTITPTLGRNRRPGAPDQKGTLASDLKGAGKDFSLKCI